MNKVLTTVYLDVEQDAALRLLAERTGRSMASFVREGLDIAIERHKAELPPQHDDGGPDGG